VDTLQEILMNSKPFPNKEFHNGTLFLFGGGVFRDVCEPGAGGDDSN
jgi:hypothetical protein